MKQVTLNAEICGSGQPIIFLHGNGESGRIFKDMPALLGDGYMCVLPDTRGHGKSAYAPLDYGYFAEDLKGIIEYLSLRKPIAVGFSDGAITLLKALIDYPGLIGKAVVAGANLSPEGLRPLDLKMFRLGYRITHSEYLNLMITQPNITEEQLNRIDCPTLILAGEKDLVLREDTLKQHSSIPGSGIKILPGENHIGYVRDNAKLYAAIKDFISG